MNDRPGCLSGLLKLSFLTWIFNWLQDRFGFGKGASCSGCTCGVLMLIVFVLLSCWIITGTSWTNFSF